MTILVGSLSIGSVNALDLYVNIDAGYGLGNATKNSQARDSYGNWSTGGTFPSNTMNETSLSGGSGVIFGGGLGMILNETLSVDLNLNYRIVQVKFRQAYIDTGIQEIIPLKTNVSSFVLLPKIHYMVPVGKGIRLGGFAGIGYTANTTRDMTLEWVQGTEIEKGKTTSDLALTVGGEGSYSIGAKTNLTFSIGYTSLGVAEWGKAVEFKALNGTTYTTFFSKNDRVNLESVDFMVGLQYGF